MSKFELQSTLLQASYKEMQDLKDQMQEKMDEELRVIGRNQVLVFIAAGLVALIGIGTAFLYESSSIAFQTVVLAVIIKIYGDVRCVRGQLLISQYQAGFINTMATIRDKDIINKVEYLGSKK